MKKAILITFILMPADSDNQRQLADCYVGRGKIRLALRQFDLAIADFDKVLNETPEHLMAVFYHGQAYVGKKNK